MTTLNARANQAFHALVEEAGENWFGFDHQRDAFEEGWETGYKAAQADAAPAVPQPVDREALIHAIVAVSVPEGSDCILGREYVENWADVFADAVLALLGGSVLAGEQEQVAPE